MTSAQFHSVLLLCSSLSLQGAGSELTGLGAFSSQQDIGDPARKGSARFDSKSGTYAVEGGGANMWFTNDAFHFVWKQATGDLSLAADIRWPSQGGNTHRKACLIIRQSLDPDSAYADAVLHGDGLTSLQYRERKGGLTREIQSNVTAPRRLRLEKDGHYVSLSVAREGGDLESAGGSFRIRFEEPFYIGLGVCAHDNAALERAVFSNIVIAPLPANPGAKRTLESTLETIDIASKDRRVVHRGPVHFEAPNWTPDGKTLLYNSGGRLFTLPVAGGTPRMLETGFANRCNNDHGISPDGRELAISDQSQGGKSLIYVLPIGGGTPRLVTPLGPSYWHGWSPDGRTLVYCGERGGEFDVYSIPAAGGEEARLTTAKGLDDGPEYSPDGRFIYFNSDRNGLMQIWRMRPDGSGQEPVVADGLNNWFAHPSPDGKWLVFLSYEPDVKGHPENKDVTLRLMPAGGGEIQVLAKLFGGQGTINVPSWSPDSRKVAFVSYRLVAPETSTNASGSGAR